MVGNSQGLKLFLVLVTVMVSAITMTSTLPILSHVKNIQNDFIHRAEKSTNNLSRVTGTGKKIRIYIKDKYLQLFNDGTVNATDDENSDYSIMQRTSVNVGQVKILGVATCTYLCLDQCGLLYSTHEFNDECIFHEMLDEYYHNTYTSTKYSDDKYTFYVAITKRGIPRKVQIKADTTLGKFASCVSVLPQLVDDERLMELEKKLTTRNNEFHHNLRHHQVCPPPHHARIMMSLKCHNQLEKKKKEIESMGISDISSAEKSMSLKKKKSDKDFKKKIKINHKLSQTQVTETEKLKFLEIHQSVTNNYNTDNIE